MSKFAPALAQFITTANRQGTKVEALLDEPTFLLPEKKQQLGQFLQAIQEYNRRAPAPGRFAAIHLDLELQQLPAWRERQAELARFWVDTVKWVKSRVPSLPLVVDLPIWLARWQIPFWQEVIQAADEVVFMAYEQKIPGQLLTAFTQEWALAVQLKKPVWIGLSLSDFAGQGQKAFWDYASQVHRQAPYPLAGLALFKYPDYQRLGQ
jgi:hypothetical protein